MIILPPKKSMRCTDFDTLMCKNESAILTDRALYK